MAPRGDREKNRATLAGILQEDKRGRIEEILREHHAVGYRGRGEGGFGSRYYGTGTGDAQVG